MLFHIFSAKVRIQTVLIFGVAIAMLIILDRLVNATRLGKAIRAVAQDADTASLMGDQRQPWSSCCTFIVGGLLAGAGGFLYAQVFNASYNMGFIPGIKAFTAAVLGGIGNVRGAMLGGCCSGVVEAYGGDILGASYIDVTAFLVLVLILLFRPSGPARRAAGEGGMSAPAGAGHDSGMAGRLRELWRPTAADRGRFIACVLIALLLAIVTGQDGSGDHPLRGISWSLHAPRDLLRARRCGLWVVLVVGRRRRAGHAAGPQRR